MGEKIKIAEFELDNIEALVKSTSELKGEIERLAQANKELDKTNEKQLQQFVRNEAQLKTLRAQYNANSKVLGQAIKPLEEVEKALKKEINTIDEAVKNNKELRDQRNLVNANTKEGAAAITAINKKIDQNTNFIKNNSSAYEKQKQNIGAYTKAINKARIGSKAFGAILKSLGIGLIIATVAKLSQAFTRNQKVMDTVNTVFSAVGIVFDKVVGSLVEGVRAAYDATGGFDALFRVMRGLLTLALTPLKATFFGVKLAIQETQLAWEQSFFGDKDQDTIRELNKNIENTRNDLREIGNDAKEAGRDIVDSFSEAIDEVGTLGNTVAASTTRAISSIDFKEVINDARALVDAKNNTEALILAQERLILQYQTQAEQLRQIRDDETLSIQERIAANEELGNLLEKQGEAEKQIVAIRIAAAQREASLNSGNIEAQNEVLRLKNELFEIEERLTGQRSEKLANDNSLRNEELARIKEFEDTKKALRDEIDLRNIEGEKEREALKVQREYEAHLLELERLQLNAREKSELEALLEEKKQQDLADIKERYREDEKQGEKKLQDFRIKARTDTLDKIVGLVGEETVIGKAAIIAKQALAFKEYAIESGLFNAKTALKTSEATVDIAAGTVKSAAAAPFPANLALIAGFIASVGGLFATIKNAISKKKPTPKFEKGGLLQGPRHSQGGIPIEAEGGEFIMNRKATRAFGPVLSIMNEIGNGNKGINTTGYFADGGQVARSISANGGPSFDDVRQLIAESQTTIRVVNVAQNTLDKINESAKIVENASI